MTEVKAAVADAKLAGSIMANPAIATAKTAIATDNAMIVLFASFTKWLTAIKPAKQALTTDIAANACFNPSGSSRLIIAIAAASNKNAKPIFMIIEPALSACSPLRFDTAIKAVINTLSTLIIVNPFLKSSTDIPAIIFIVTTISSNAAPIFMIIEPALSAFSPPSLDIAINPTIRSSKAAITAIPFDKSFTDINDTIRITPTRINKAALIFISILPTSFRPAPANFVTAISPAIKRLSAAITPIPLLKPSAGILAKIFIVTATNKSEAPNFIAILPTSSISPVLNEDNFMKAITTALKVRITATPLVKPSSDIPSIIFTHHATIINAAPNDKKTPPDDN